MNHQELNNRYRRIKSDKELRRFMRDLKEAVLEGNFESAALEKVEILKKTKSSNYHNRSKLVCSAVWRKGDTRIVIKEEINLKTSFWSFLVRRGNIFARAAQ